MIVNRIGDVGLALGICVSFLTFKSVDYATTFAMVPLIINKNISFFCFDLNVFFVISFLLF